ncbi:MAG: accessory factor UbiK family protein [Gammaproteobacteria bacterium]|nr:accessory factor UbiK family protein [Gammaproteobacteria bacterium]
MSNSNFIKNLASQLSELLPTQIEALKKDFEKNCHAQLLQIFNKFELVTREEFDTQTKVLLRTRKKLSDLEKQIEALNLKSAPQSTS